MMLKIRKDQMAVMDQLALKHFEDQTAEELKQSFPKHARLLGEEKLRQRVREGFARARVYGLSSQNGLRLFVELTFLLGNAFDTDPQVSWAAQILSDSAAEEATRVERLYQKTTDYLQSVCGPNGEHIHAALAKVRGEALEGFPQSGLGAFQDFMLRRFLLLYPEKCRHVGEPALRRLIESGLQPARSYGLVTERGVTLLLALMFLLGSGFHQDSQFAFAAKVLADASLTDPNQKAERLKAEALAYLEQWLA
jgi:hypothetical protein